MPTLSEMAARQNYTTPTLNGCHIEQNFVGPILFLMLIDITNISKDSSWFIQIIVALLKATPFKISHPEKCINVVEGSI